MACCVGLLLDSPPNKILFKAKTRENVLRNHFEMLITYPVGHPTPQELARRYDRVIL